LLVPGALLLRVPPAAAKFAVELCHVFSLSTLAYPGTPMHKKATALPRTKDFDFIRLLAF
jgi:hypothetical protein